MITRRGYLATCALAPAFLRADTPETPQAVMAGDVVRRGDASARASGGRASSGARRKRAQSLTGRTASTPPTIPGGSS